MDGGAVDGGAADDGGAPVDAGLGAGTLDVQWIHGSPSCNQSGDPPLQVHAYNDDTYVLRQSKCVNFEGPFLHLLFGEDKVLLEDTGATSSAAAFPVHDVVEDVIAGWLAARGRSRDSLELVVVHSHAHGDHVAGDGQFQGRPGTTVVGTGVAAVSSFFGLASWPEETAAYDLGGRVVDVIPIPGHQASHIALYDRRTGLLFTGDSLYPGRLYVNDWDAFRASVARLVAFTEARPVTWVLGTHVEMSSTPGDDYPIGSTYQPDEHVLQLTREHLLELDAALTLLGNNPMLDVHDDFIVYPL